MPPEERDLFYRILPGQVPYFWEAIKFTVVKTDEVDESSRPFYFNELLQALLSEKAQCFVVLDINKILNAILLTRIIIDRVSQQKELFIQNLYSMKTVSDDNLRFYFNFIKKFAVKEDCRVLTFNSRNPRIWDIADVVDCYERYRSFACKVGGV